MTAAGVAFTPIPQLPPLGFLAAAEPACRDADVDPEWFFSFHGGNTDPYVRARPVCARCPVQQDCAEWALEASTLIALEGLWGGLSPEERAATHIGRTSSPRQEVSDGQS